MISDTVIVAYKEKIYHRFGVSLCKLGVAIVEKALFLVFQTIFAEIISDHEVT